jgi:hypothetical protein
VLESKSSKEIASLTKEAERFVFRLVCDTGNLSKVEKAEQDFKDWKTKNGFDQRSDIEEIQQCLSDM